MGKGDKRTKRGKRVIGSYGVSRKRKTEAKPAPKKAKKAKKPAAKKAAPKKEAAPAAAEDKSLKSMTVAELKDMAKGKEISGYSTMKKAELIEALS